MQPVTHGLYPALWWRETKGATNSVQWSLGVEQGMIHDGSVPIASKFLLLLYLKDQPVEHLSIPPVSQPMHTNTVLKCIL